MITAKSSDWFVKSVDNYLCGGKCIIMAEIELSYKEKLLASFLEKPDVCSIQ